MIAPPQILIAGIGNIFLGDDAFGVHVVRRLMQRSWPQGVRVGDFGIRGLDLVYAITDGPELAILIDAAPRGQAPGTLHVIEPEHPAADLNAGMDVLEAHSMDPARVLRLARAMGASTRVLIVGCEPTPFDPDADMPMDLSPAVRAAIEPAVAIVESLAARHLAPNPDSEVQHASQDVTSTA